MLIINLDLLNNNAQPLIKIFGITIIEWIINSINENPCNKINDIIILFNNKVYETIIKNLVYEKYEYNFIFLYYNENDMNIINIIYNELLGKVSKNSLIKPLIKSLKKSINSSNSSNQLKETPIIEKHLLYIDTKNLFLDDIQKIWNSNNYNNMIFYKYNFIGFESLDQFVLYCNKLINLGLILLIKKITIEHLINLMISDNIIFNNYNIDENNVINLETHFNIRLLCNNYPKINALNNRTMIYPKRICFDLDDILLNDKKDFINYLKKLGNIIIINTKYNNSENEFVQDLLHDSNIMFDEIYYNKLIADFYINSKAINFNSNLEKELGFYNNNIDTRDFNEIEYSSAKIYKKKSSDLSGEIYYYLNIPNQIKDIFPIMIDYDKDFKKWYDMENINGIPVSRLYLDEELTLTQFDNIIGTMCRIHNCSIYTSSINDNNLINNQSINIYNNYINKLKERYKNYDYSIYLKSEEIYNYLLLKLEIYEKNKSGKFSIIHGDTVFTNILINQFGKIKLIDMRGKIGDVLTIYGDKFYDWAKMYQSLIGYDEILENKNVSDKYRTEFIKYFETYFLNIYTKEDLDNLKILTASLLFTLIPLHNNNKCLLYYNLIKNLII